MQNYGKIKAIKVIYKSKVAFVSFHARSAAELAISTLFNKLFIKNKKLKLLWAKS